MIPKKIHYCWFGGNPLPEMAQKCIASWKKYCPDYEIIEWNESNFDLNYCDYVKEAYEAKKWAFVSDVARLYALVTEGGIYMDTDVEVIKPLDDLLQYEAVSGFESDTEIPTGLMACEKGHRMFVEFLEDYNGDHFVYKAGEMGLETNIKRMTSICSKYNFVPNNTLQVVNGLTLLPKDYLCPKNHETRRLNLTENTLVIHHFDGSWLNEEEKYIQELKEKLYAKVPNRISGLVASFVGNAKYHGVGYAVKKIFKWLKKEY